MRTRLGHIIIASIAALLAAATPCRALASLPDSTSIVATLSTIGATIPLPYHHDLAGSIAKQKGKAVPLDLTQNANTIERIINEHGMPAELKFLPLCLKTGDNSRCGDWGLTPIVAVRYGLAITARHDERFALEASTHAALSYLADLHEHYGDWWKSIMAFAYGPATVNKTATDISNAWDYEATIDYAHIVRNFITYLYLYHDKELTPKDDNHLEVEFGKPIAINVMADKLRMATSEIIELNPIFLGDTIFPLGNYQLRLPARKAEMFYRVEEELYTARETTHDTVASKPVVAQTQQNTTKPIRYKVKKGDTLSKIAQKHGTSVEMLKRLNNLSSDAIREGQTLTIRNVGNPTTTVKAATTASHDKTTHTIRKGETLGTIAQKYKVSVGDLKKWNNLKNDKIIEGRKLVIYKK